jgi:hypothetical protein
MGHLENAFDLLLILIGLPVEPLLIVICKPCPERLAIQLSCLSSGILRSLAGIRASDGDIAENTT